jgi:hypothetical protein
VKILLAIGGAALLLLACGGVTYLALGDDLLKEMLLDGTPIFFDHNGKHIEVSGRVAGTVAILVPIFGLLGGVWRFG